MLLSERKYSTTAASPAAKPLVLLILISFVFFAPQLPSRSFAQTPDIWNSTESIPTSTTATIEDALAAAEFNAYDQGQVGLLSLHARQLQEDDSHLDAVAAYREAIHVLRINQGLYNPAQLDLLDAMIESEISLQNWEQVDRHYAYMENLYRRLYDITDPRLETGLQKVVSWHVNALNLNIDGKRIEHLQQANKLFKLRLHIARSTLRTDDPKLDFLNRNIEIYERQLFLASDLSREMQRRQQRARQNSLLADLD